jgi:hypothetical protein
MKSFAMRHALSALAAGLAVGWAAAAAADAPAPAAAPPAAPIFYCPTAAAAPAPAAPAPVPVVRHRRHPGQVCPTEHRRTLAQARHRHHAPAAEPTAPLRAEAPGPEVFYRLYERGPYGLERPVCPHPCPPGPPRMPPYAYAPPAQGYGPPPLALQPQCPPAGQGCPPDHGEWRGPPHEPWRGNYAQGNPPPPPALAPPPPPMPPPQAYQPPCPHACPPAAAEQPPPCPRVDHGCPPGGWAWQEERAHERDYAAQTPPAPPAPSPASGWDWDRRHDVASAHGGYAYERSESRSDSGWTYSQQDRQGAYHGWSQTAPPVRDYHDGYRDEGYRDGADASGPPTGYADGSAQWRDGSYGQVYPVAGRDANGYLVWPGKTPQ